MWCLNDNMLFVNDAVYLYVCMLMNISVVKYEDNC
jgi:hypothetical protein